MQPRPNSTHPQGTKGSVLQRSAAFWKTQRLGLFHNDFRSTKTASNELDIRSNTALKSSRNKATELNSNVNNQTCNHNSTTKCGIGSISSILGGQTTRLQRYSDLSGRLHKCSSRGLKQAPKSTPITTHWKTEKRRATQNNKLDIPCLQGFTKPTSNAFRLKSKTQNCLVSQGYSELKKLSLDSAVSSTHFESKFSQKQSNQTSCPYGAQTPKQPSGVSSIRLGQDQKTDNLGTDRPEERSQQETSLNNKDLRPSTYLTSSNVHEIKTPGRMSETKFDDKVTSLVGKASGGSEDNAPKRYLWQEALRDPGSHAFLTAPAPHLKYNKRSWLLDRDDNAPKIQFPPNLNAQSNIDDKEYVPLDRDILVDSNELQMKDLREVIRRNATARRHPLPSPHTISAVRSLFSKSKGHSEMSGISVVNPVKTSRFVPQSMYPERQQKLYEETKASRGCIKKLPKPRVSKPHTTPRVHFLLDKTKRTVGPARSNSTTSSSFGAIQAQSESYMRVSDRSNSRGVGGDAAKAQSGWVKPKPEPKSVSYGPPKLDWVKVQPIRSQKPADSRSTTTSGHFNTPNQNSENKTKSVNTGTWSSRTLSSAPTDDSKKLKSIFREKKRSDEDTTTGEFDSTFCFDQTFGNTGYKISPHNESKSTLPNTDSNDLQSRRRSSIFDISKCQLSRKGLQSTPTISTQNKQQILDPEQSSVNANFRDYWGSSYYNNMFPSSGVFSEISRTVSSKLTYARSTSSSSSSSVKEGGKRCKKRFPAKKLEVKRIRNLSPRRVTPKPKPIRTKLNTTNISSHYKQIDAAQKSKPTDAKAPVRFGGIKAIATSKKVKRLRPRSDRMYKSQENSGTIYNLNRMFYKDELTDKRVIHPLFDAITKQYRPPNNTARRAEERKFSKKVNIIHQLRKLRELKDLQGLGSKTAAYILIKPNPLPKHKLMMRRPWI